MEPFTKRIRRNPVRISIEGNIATGKSTFIKVLEDAAANEDWEITPEPVSTWTQIDGQGKNPRKEMLSQFYNDPLRWAYTMESFTFITRLHIEKQRRKNPVSVSCSINERSVYSSKYIFARNCFETGLMSETEWAIYQDWSTYLLDSLGELQLDGFIYLRADPETCAKRMSKRGRPEEQGVTVDYLKQLHEKHERWLHHKEFHGEDIMDGIPVLEIDCNMEFHDDEAMKKKMLDQVRQFVLDVQKQKQQRMCEDSGVDSYSRSISPTSTTSLSPTPFQKHRESDEELENSAPVADIKATNEKSENKENSQILV